MLLWSPASARSTCSRPGTCVGEEVTPLLRVYTNLFIASMVVLVLSDNLLLMYLGWEGVGLCFIR